VREHLGLQMLPDIGVQIVRKELHI
jgi:hypothetical protein